jgi:SRSO17 transposase
METSFEQRKQELLKECQVPPAVFEEAMPRLETFMEPFLHVWGRSEPRQHGLIYMQGLLSDLECKNVESIVYRAGLDRMGLQRFIGWAEWDDAPLRMELARQVGQQLGEPDGVLVFDPSAHPKSGTESVGVARQWCGRLGKVENCQVGVYLGYVSRKEHALVDVRLYLPKEWTRDKARCRKARVPKDRRRHRTRHQLCLEMLEEKGHLLPHSWIAGDDELGRPAAFRRDLDHLGERYLLAVPSNTLIRDLETEPPPYGGAGRYPKRPWQRVDRWLASQPDTAWTEVDVRDGAKGPLVIQILKRSVAARSQKHKEGPAETLVVIRYRDREKQHVVKVDYYLSNASSDVPVPEFARVAKAEHRIEECLQRGKSEVGLSDYEVRSWLGWYHHQTLSLLASWFLVNETRQGKKNHSGDDPSTSPRRHRPHPSPSQPVLHTRPHPGRTRKATPTQRTRALLPLEA